MTKPRPPLWPRPTGHPNPRWSAVIAAASWAGCSVTMTTVRHRRLSQSTLTIADPAEGSCYKRTMRYLTALFFSLLISPALAAPTHITFVTDWKAQAEHGGFYEALAEGLYRKAGLDVHILEGGPSVNVPQLLAAGSADMGIGSNGFIPLNMLREGAKIKAV